LKYRKEFQHLVKQIFNYFFIKICKFSFRREEITQVNFVILQNEIPGFRGFENLVQGHVFTWEWDVGDGG
jgi:hypothetical protein